MLQLIVKHDKPPIPVRQYDWQVIDRNYEPGCPIGYGRTLPEAIEDYLGEYAFRNEIDKREIKYKWS